MPDWTYHPVLRPVGIALHGPRTREVTLRRLGWIAARPTGRWLIRFLGHSAPSPEAAVEKGGFRLKSPVMLGPKVDPSGTAAEAFDQMELGLIEVDGPQTPPLRNASLVRRVSSKRPALTADIWRCQPDEMDHWRASEQPVLVDVDEHVTTPTLRRFAESGAGIAMEGPMATLPDRVRNVRQELGEQPLIAAGGEVSSPRDALELRCAGADVIIVNEGLAKAGPGLAKRISESLLSGGSKCPPNADFSRWAPAAAFGIGAIIAALIAMYIALTTVILGYDERMTGISRADLNTINPFLLDFMRHDRLSYAGATLSIGILYFALAFFGVRRREEWAFHTFVVSGLGGFVSFLLFFTFGYFDIGNAAVAIVLLVPFVVALSRRPKFAPAHSPLELDNDKAWRRALTGQLLLVSMSIGLIIGGATSCAVGATNVFVVSDLHFLHSNEAAFTDQSPQLLPLIAHDRVSFGGAIVCNGIAALLISMWGLRRGRAWAWWSLALAGTVNLAFTFYAHFSTGYTELAHLAPVVVGALFLVAGLILTFEHLVGAQRVAKPGLGYC